MMNPSSPAPAAAGASHAPDGERLHAMSRELSLACDTGGTIRWADPRAVALVGARAGIRLADLAVEGSAEKVERFLDVARQEPTRGWELHVTDPVEGRTPITLAAQGVPDGEGGVLVVASLVPHDYGLLLNQMSAAMSELATLGRETERQQREIAERRAELKAAGDRIESGETNLREFSRQLADSTAGLRALYSELDEKDTSLRQVTEVKSRFVANVSHELRTPLNSILGMTRLLLAKQDGELTAEQERQIGYVRRSAQTLSELVDDLLDLAKMESGKVALRPSHFTVDEIFATLRGMMRPIATNPDVALVFEGAPAGLPVFETDEGKVAQVLRNLVSNALKFTATGEVRVGAHAGPAEGHVSFTVRDTGVGIAPADRERVFEEFAQVENPMQQHVKGTGLGLSVSRRLAEVLGGRLTLESTLGAGSTFTLTIPTVHPETVAMHALEDRARQLDPTRSPVLVVEDDRQTLFLYEKYLEGSGFQVVPARSIEDAREVLTRVQPAAIVLDILLEGEATWTFLGELKASEKWRDIPTLVVTVTDREQKARALGADEFFLKPLDRDWLLRKLTLLAKTGPMQKILVIDDDEVARYLVRKLVVGTEYQVIEAADGPEGIRRAREDDPHLIILDFVMPQMTAFEVLDELKADPKLRCIPVIISTSKTLSETERARLQQDTAAILSKHSLSREVAIARIRDALGKAVDQGAGGPA